MSLSVHLPRGKYRVQRVLSALASENGVTPSTYGPLLESRPDDLTFRLCAYGAYGNYFSDFLRKRSASFSFLDIGANIGLYSLIAAKNKHCKQCYAFEPNPAVFHSLVNNIALNEIKNIEPKNAAISERAGMLRFSAPDGHSGAGGLSESGTMEVQALDRLAFDEIASRDNLPKIVKIDVEGYEPVVIDQLIRSNLWPTITDIYFEAAYERYDVDSVKKTLEKKGFIFVAQIETDITCDLMYRRA